MTKVIVKSELRLSPWGVAGTAAQVRIAPVARSRQSLGCLDRGSRGMAVAISRPDLVAAAFGGLDRHQRPVG